MREVRTTSGVAFFVDDEDFERVTRHTWAFAGRSLSTVVMKNRKRTRFSLPRFIMGSDGTPMFGHRNGDVLDNTRSNLVPVSGRKEKAGLRRKDAGEHSSKYKGVHFEASSKRWRASLGLRVDGKQVTRQLGRYINEVDAALRYDAAALEHFGELAVLNFPEGNQ